jgi:hypothetical protein
VVIEVIDHFQHSCSLGSDLKVIVGKDFYYGSVWHNTYQVLSGNVFSAVNIKISVKGNILRRQKQIKK